jgi:hypothetical protein
MQNRREIRTFNKFKMSSLLDLTAQQAMSWKHVIYFLFTIVIAMFNVPLALSGIVTEREGPVTPTLAIFPPTSRRS